MYGTASLSLVKEMSNNIIIKMLLKYICMFISFDISIIPYGKTALGSITLVIIIINYN